VRRPALWLTAMLLFACGGMAQSSLGARFKLRWGRDTVRFSVRGETHEVSIRKYFYAARLANVKLESAEEAGGFIYLLLDVTGPSKDPPDSHQCGAGSESDLIWLKLDKDWKLTDAKQFRYDSCWSTISSYDDLSWDGDRLSVTADYVKEGGTVTTMVASYSYKHPEEGLKVTETSAEPAR
jgi:hypothetical protein